jgi:hypothetical protein
MKRRPAVGDRVESIKTSRATYSGASWVPGMRGELTAYPAAVRAYGCAVCGTRHETFALVEFWTYTTEGPLRKVHDRVALPICDIRQI